MRPRLFRSTADDYFDSGYLEYPLPARALIGFCKRVVWAFTKIYWPWTCDGPNPYRERRPEGATGRVLVCNHASMLDPVLFVVMAQRRWNIVRPLYKSELDQSRFVKWYLSRAGAIPVHRGKADTKAIRRAVAALKRGENVLVFPEGTRIWDPEARPELHGGFSLIAAMAGADVVPVAIDGTERINPEKRSKLCRPSRVRIRFGEPVSLDQAAGDTRRERADSLERLAMGKVYEMRAELRAERGRRP